MRLNHDHDSNDVVLDEREDLVTGEAGIIKYGIAYLLGVPVTLLVLIFLVSRGC